MTKRTLLMLAGGTLFIMGSIGVILIPLARKVSLFHFFMSGMAIWQQLVLGTLLGVVLGCLAAYIVQSSFFNQVFRFFSDIFKPFHLSIWHILWISCCAGIGEELLFRGAIQPWLGIALTSILFVLLHGYLNPFNKPLFLYGLFMVLVIMLLGYLTETWGIFSAISAHIIIDVVLFIQLTRKA